MFSKSPAWGSTLPLKNKISKNRKIYLKIKKYPKKSNKIIFLSNILIKNF